MYHDIDSNQYPGRVDQTRLVGEEGIITIPATKEEEKDGEQENGENILNRTEGVTDGSIRGFSEL